MPITLQGTVGGFSAEFMQELPRVEQAMTAHGLDPADFIISKDNAASANARPLGPFFYDYTVFVGDETSALALAHADVGADGRGEPRRAAGRVLLELDVRPRSVECDVDERRDADVERRRVVRDAAGDGLFEAHRIACPAERRDRRVIAVKLDRLALEQQNLLDVRVALAAQPEAHADRRDVDIGALVQQHSRRVFQLAFRMMRNEQDAEDVVQECFLRAYRQLGRFEARAGETSPRLWRQARGNDSTRWRAARSRRDPASGPRSS